MTHHELITDGLKINPTIIFGRNGTGGIWLTPDDYNKILKALFGLSDEISQLKEIVAIGKKEKDETLLGGPEKMNQTKDEKSYITNFLNKLNKTEESIEPSKIKNKPGRKKKNPMQSVNNQ